MQPWHATVLVFLALGPREAVALSGHLAYLSRGAAWVQRLDAPHRQPAKLPYSEGATAVTLAPPTGTALYTVSMGKQLVKVLRSDPPYRTARRLDLPAGDYERPMWTGDGRLAFLTAGGRCWEYRARNGGLTRLPFVVRATSKDGSVVAIYPAGKLTVRWRSSGREVVIFDEARPDKLLNAVRRTRNSKFSEFFLDPPEPRRAFGADAATLGPDGRSLYFLSNLGTPSAASGALSYVTFRADARTGQTAALDWMGAVSSSIRYWSVSPEGECLLAFVASKCGAFHADSADCYDLGARQHRDLTERPHQFSLLDGTCWSPDGRYVAVAVSFYRSDDPKVCPPGDDRLHAPPYRLHIYRATTGQLVFRGATASGVSWSL